VDATRQIIQFEIPSHLRAASNSASSQVVVVEFGSFGCQP
jgi:hypothetical protein